MMTQKSSYDALIEGCEFLKFGKKGKPHYKRVICTNDGYLYWLSAQDSKPVNQLSRDAKNCISLSQVTTVIRGKHSEVFHRKVAHSAPDKSCFTIVTKARTLDLQAPSQQIRDVWVDQLIAASLIAQKGGSLASSTTTSVISSSEDSSEISVSSPSESYAELAPDTVSPTNQSSGSSGFTPEQKKLVRFLDQGEEVLRHTRRGTRRRWLHVAKGKLFTTDPKVLQSTDSLDSSRSHKGQSYIKLVNIVQVLVGNQTKGFENVQVDSDTCFSIVTEDRTLDIQVRTKESRDKWVEGITFAKRKATEIRTRKWLTQKKRGDVLRSGTLDSTSLKQLRQMKPVRTRSDTYDTVQEVKSSDRIHIGTLKKAFTENTHYSSTNNHSHNNTNNSNLNNPADVRRHRSYTQPNTPANSNYLQEFNQASNNVAKLQENTVLNTRQLHLLDLVTTGGVFVKYGRLGNPKKKFINIDEGKLFWAPAAFGRTSSDSKVTTFILLLRVKGILAGKITKVFGRRCAQKVSPSVCFSVITDERTLDLEARTPKERDEWVTALKFIVQRTKEEILRQQQAHGLLATYAVKTLKSHPEAINQLPLKKLANEMKQEDSILWSARDYNDLSASKITVDTISGSISSRKPASKQHIHKLFEQAVLGDYSKASFNTDGTTNNLSGEGQIEGSNDNETDARNESGTPVAGSTDDISNNYNQYTTPGGPSTTSHDNEYIDTDVEDPGPPSMPPPPNVYNGNETEIDYTDVETANDFTDADFTEVDEPNDTKVEGVDNESEEESETEEDDDDLGDLYESPRPQIGVVMLPKQESETFMNSLHDALKMLNEASSRSASQRTSAISHISNLCKGKPLDRVQGFWSFLRKLQTALAKQFKDERVAVVRIVNGCILVLTEALGDNSMFANFMVYMLPIMMKRIIDTNKTIGALADQCIRQMLRKSLKLAPQLIPLLIVSAKTDSHAALKTRACLYLGQILTDCAADSTLDDHILQLASVITTNIKDENRDVKVASRKLFLAFERLWPQAGKKLVQKFSEKLQKILKAERRQFKKWLKARASNK